MMMMMMMAVKFHRARALRLGERDSQRLAATATCCLRAANGGGASLAGAHCQCSGRFWCELSHLISLGTFYCRPPAPAIGKAARKVFALTQCRAAPRRVSPGNQPQREKLCLNSGSRRAPRGH